MTNKPYRELTRQERLIRFRKLANAALSRYGLSDTSLQFIQYNENVIYRVHLPDASQISQRVGPYEPTSYALRLHAWEDMEKINSEMVWLAALAEEAELPVPAPIPTLDGKMVVKVHTQELPQGKCVTLLRWLKGRKLEKGIRPVHLTALGRVIARLHDFSARWHPPEEFIRPYWNWESQLGGSLFDVSLESLIDSMAVEHQEPFKIVSQRAKEAMEALGQDSDAFGLIHADLYPENILFHAGKAYPIDFEDCGFGYWIWDIAVALCTWAWKPGWESMRDAFYEGYSEIRSLPDEQWAMLDLFIAAQFATMAIWASAFLVHDPIRKSEYDPWRDESCQRLSEYFHRH